jgi:hypothetical protein
MTIPKTQSDRRKAGRQAHSLRMSWRMLGSRDLRFGGAALKDIGTDGLALQIDRPCPKGTVVIVQFEGAAEPMLLRAEWASELQPTQAETMTYLIGCSFASPLGEKDLKTLLTSIKNAAPALPKQTINPIADPFLMGSASEKRSLARRGGLIVPVVMRRAIGGSPLEASVVDRSLKGLGILSHRTFARGTLLNVRPRDAYEKNVSVQVEVRNCRQKGNQWLLGCNFLSPPTGYVLMLLG